jgi:glycerol-3-phosphate dehydrogenase
MFFVIPWLGHAWVGTTDTDYPGDPAGARATPSDAAYLLRSARQFFPDLGEPRWSNAGVRALVTATGNESSVSRLHRVRAASGRVDVIGGKITGYRSIAEEATNAVCRQLGVRRRATTAEAPLPGAAASQVAGDLASEVAHAVRHEQCLRVSDFLLRRTLRGFAPDQGLSELEAVADALAAPLGWSAARRREEVEFYRAWVRESRPASCR